MIVPNKVTAPPFASAPSSFMPIALVSIQGPSKVTHSVERPPHTGGPFSLYLYPHATNSHVNIFFFLTAVFCHESATFTPPVCKGLKLGQQNQFYYPGQTTPQAEREMCGSVLGDEKSPTAGASDKL